MLGHKLKSATSPQLAIAMSAFLYWAPEAEVRGECVQWINLIFCQAQAECVGTSVDTLQVAACHQSFGFVCGWTEGPWLYVAR